MEITEKERKDLAYILTDSIVKVLENKPIYNENIKEVKKLIELKIELFQLENSLHGENFKP